MDFGDEQESTIVATNSSKENDDVEVKHTIVVSTKLKNNNNRRGLHTSRDDGGPVAHTFSQGRNIKEEDSGEVPVMKGYKAVETTKILTPDTRLKSPVSSVNGYTRYNAPDEYDIYPNIVTNPMQFKPSNFYNNINWGNQQSSRSFNNYNRRNDRTGFPNVQQSGFHRSISDDSVRDFYCKKCRELGGMQDFKGCIQQRSNPWYNENTTPKIKIDGKLVKLN
ncbi:unnamed protein product [Parnassius mnemosyne]|uniref:Uncharacterized protein n=1 Tax=Parnassius mnemosyne TaxID=213953 RepID=A0AAV1M3I8_9NEOP